MFFGLLSHIFIKIDTGYQNIGFITLNNYIQYLHKGFYQILTSFYIFLYLNIEEIRMGPCAASKRIPENTNNQPLAQKGKKITEKIPETLPSQINYASLLALHNDNFALKGKFMQKVEDKFKDEPSLKYIQIGNIYFLNREYLKAFQSFLKSIIENKDQSLMGYGNREEKVGLYQGDLFQWYARNIQLSDLTQSAWDGLALSALQCIQQKQYLQKQLIKLKDQCGNTYQINLVLGHLYYNTKNFQLALEFYRQAEKFNINSLFVLLGIGHSLFKLKLKKQSEEYYDKALLIDPFCAFAYIGKSKIAMKTEKQKQYLQKAHQCNENYGRPLNNLGNYYIQTKQYFEAIYFFKKCNDVCPKYMLAYYGKAIAYTALKKNDEAIQSYQKCVELDPSHFQSRINLGNLYRNIKKYEQAVQNFESALLLNPKSEIAYNGLGNVYSVMKNYSKAIQCYMKCIQINPNHHSQYNGLGNIYSEMQKFEQAIKYYKKAIQVNSSPNYSTPYNGLGIAYNNLNNFDEAIKAFNKCIQINPKYQVAFNGLGNVYKKMKQYNEAIKCYKQAIQLKSEYSSPYNGLGNIYKQLRQFHKAIECYKSCIKLTPNNPLFDLNLAMAFIEIENYGEAFETFKVCEKKVKGANLQKAHLQFIQNSLQNFKQQEQQWEYRIKIGFVSDEQKMRIKQMKQQFQKRYQQLFNSDSQSKNMDQQTVLNKNFLKICQLIYAKEWDENTFKQMASQVFQLFKQSHDSFQIMAQILCNYFYMKKFMQKGTTQQIQNQISVIMKHLCKNFSPTDERAPIEHIQFPSKKERKINLFNETQYFSSYQGIVNQIQKINNKSKEVKPQFVKIVKSVEKQCNGFKSKAGLKLPDSPEKWFKVIIRIMQKMFKQIKQEKQNIIRQIQTKIDQQEQPSMLKIVKIIMEVWINKVNRILQQRKKQKIPTQCYLSDLVRGKCLFHTPQDIKTACQFLINYCQKQNYQITQIDNRINKVTHDIVFKILIDGIVCQLQLDIQFEEDKFEYGHSFYEIQRSPLGCIFGTYLILSKGTQYSFFSRVKDAIELLKNKQQSDEIRSQNLEALEFVESILRRSNGNK